MGFLDDAVPGGNIAKPLIIALGTLLIGRMMSGGSARQQPETSPMPQPQPGGGSFAGSPSGGVQGPLMGGLGGLLERLTQSGHGEVANSWVGTGQNVPIQPTQLGSALGQTTVAELAQHAGMTEQELLAQLSRVLPGVVDKLTPAGKVPSQSEVTSLWGS